jgi:CHAD domain-containing protein
VRLGTLVQDYVGTQCGILLGARRAIAHRDETIVHPARVAIRRLRATLRTFGAVYSADERERLRVELRWAGGLLGEVRDLQVLEERFAPAADTAVVAGAHKVIQSQIEHDRTRAWDAAIAALDGERGSALFAAVQRWRDDPPFAEAATRKASRAKKPLRKADERLQVRLDRARAAAGAGDPEAGELLHDARKAGKRHRYAVELAAPVLGEGADARIERSQELQDVLGAHQDSVVALAYLRRIDVAAEPDAVAGDLAALIAQTRERADDVGGALSEIDRLRE